MTVPVEVLPEWAYRTGEDFVAACKPTDLVYFLLNVGDGDTQLILLPESGTGVRRVVVVDVATTKKLPALLDALGDAGLLKEPPPGTRPIVELVVATHPHEDHIGGLPELLEALGPQVAEFWEPGYFHTGASYMDTMRVLEDLEHRGHGVRQSQPTSGYTRYIGQVQVTVLTPAIWLRNRFDTWGIDINNSSIAMRLTFPASRVVQDSGSREYVRTRAQRLLLGADAQTVSWAHAMTDFPELHTDRSEAAKALRVAVGTDPLKANVFKVPHHMSKHGLSLELVELVSPNLSLVSSVAGGGKYNFPHAVAQESLREALQATTGRNVPRKADHELGIHYTGSLDPAGAPYGTIAVVMSPTGGRALWRFRDGPKDKVDLASGVRFAL